jgi:polyvinyl alcohol dehydrogenase (cytochrome)
MSPGSVNKALLEGNMQAQAAALSIDERMAVVAYISNQSFDATRWKSSAMCSNTQVDTSMPATVSTFGFDHKNHRRLSAIQAGLKTEDFANLEFAWALAFPNVTMMRAQPAIVGNTLFLTPVETQEVYAFDISGKPCLKWIYTADRKLRSSLTYGILPGSGRPILVFGDLSARIHAIDARTGKGLWVSSLKRFPESIITGTPQIFDGRIYATVSQYEILVGADPQHECCKARGAVASLDASTGEIIWFTPTLPDAKPVRDRGDGQKIWGPSGAPVWTSPAMDVKRGVLYVGTGGANSEPAHLHTDAILAIKLDTGKIDWVFQANADDIFLLGCWGEHKQSLNCPPDYSINRDIDFGASVVIAERDDGSDVLLAGQKSSVVWALDPDNKGAVLWKWSKGLGTSNGGIHWGLAYDGKRVFAPISDSGLKSKDSPVFPGLYALNVENGELLWSYSKKPECYGRSRALPRCHYQYGYSAAPLVIDGAVVQGSLDGFLTVFDAKTGNILLNYDTLQPYNGVNGVKGHGGAIDNASLAAANGMLFVSSGYGMFGQPEGNVLLAFRPGKQLNSE